MLRNEPMSRAPHVAFDCRLKERDSRRNLVTLTEEISSCTGVLTSGQTSSLTFLASAARDHSISELPIVVWQPGLGFCSSHCNSQHIPSCNACRASEFVQGLISGANKAGVFASPTATAYWAYHLTRTGFLAVQGLSGLHSQHRVLQAIKIHPPDSDSLWLTMSTSRLAAVLVRVNLLNILQGTCHADCL